MVLWMPQAFLAILLTHLSWRQVVAVSLDPSRRVEKGEVLVASASASVDLLRLTGDVSQQQLVAGSPCAPGASELLGALQRQQVGEEKAGAEIRFFLHSEGVFNLSDRVKCYLDAVGGDDVVGVDSKVMPNVAEHILDYRMLNHLLDHPLRTTDPAAADLFIVGAALGTSWHATQLDSQECGSEVEHYERVDAIVKALRTLPAFQKKNGSNYVFIDSDWNYNTVFGHALMGMLHAGPAILATADTTIAGFGGMKSENVVVIPYKAHADLDLDATDALSGDRLLRTTRNVTVAFHGTMSRIRQGQYRFGLKGLAEQVAGASIRDVRCYDYDTDECVRIVRDTAATLRQSQFCLVPSGDTPSSRRLFDALAAGCVPIILNKLEDIVPNLPFPRSIDWSKIALFAGSLECMAHNVTDTSEWLNRLVALRGPAALPIEEMRRRGREVFSKFLTYHRNGISTGFLTEVAAVVAR